MGGTTKPTSKNDAIRSVADRRDRRTLGDPILQSARAGVCASGVVRKSKIFVTDRDIVPRGQRALRSRVLTNGAERLSNDDRDRAGAFWDFGSGYSTSY
jgi:hypothetical protein